MKKYSCKRAKKGKIAYRTPSKFIYKMVLKPKKEQIRKNEKQFEK